MAVFRMATGPEVLTDTGRWRSLCRGTGIPVWPNCREAAAAVGVDEIVISLAGGLTTGRSPRTWPRSTARGVEADHYTITDRVMEVGMAEPAVRAVYGWSSSTPSVRSGRGGREPAHLLALGSREGVVLGLGRGHGEGRGEYWMGSARRSDGGMGVVCGVRPAGRVMPCGRRHRAKCMFISADSSFGGGRRSRDLRLHAFRWVRFPGGRDSGRMGEFGVPGFDRVGRICTTRDRSLGCAGHFQGRLWAGGPGGGPPHAFASLRAASARDE